MKKTLLTLLITLFITNWACCAETAGHIILSDFRNVNLFEAFYVCDKNHKDCSFTPLNKVTYSMLTPENKAIYKKVKKSDEIYRHATSSKSKKLRENALQKAYKINYYNLPAANALVYQFEKDKKFSTALYYALQIKKYDKKHKYPDIDYRIGNLYYSLEYFDESLLYFEKARKSLIKNKNNPELLKEVNKKINTIKKTYK